MGDAKGEGRVPGHPQTGGLMISRVPIRQHPAAIAQHPIFAATLAVVVSMAVAAAPSRASSSTVTFNDLTDTLTASATSSRITTTPCGFIHITLMGQNLNVEGCTATITGPSGSSSFTAPSMVFIGGDNGHVSDLIMISPGAIADTALVTFASDPIEEMPFMCSDVGGCAISENGRLQLGAQIKWNNRDHTKDKIKFASDVEMVPEPASLVLLGGGLLAMAGYIRRRRR
jgi:PEP-CTERM motif